MHNIPLSIIAKDSFSTLINPVIVRYNNYRKLQYTLEKSRALRIALSYIKAKIAGMANILRYYKREPPPLQPPPEMPGDAEEYEHIIRVWESTSSSLLWDGIATLLKPEILDELREQYGFHGRKPRHSDPFNKTLSVMYAVLYSIATKALLAAGLDPTYGFLHKTRYSTPLTFDYTEMFKPAAIQATIELLNTQGLPELDADGELARDSVNKAIRKLYEYLTLRHRDTGKTLYQQMYLKAFCLAKHLEGRCRDSRLTITWNRNHYRRRRAARGP